MLFPQTREIPPEAAALIGAFMRLTEDAAFREECADWLTEYKSSRWLQDDSGAHFHGCCRKTLGTPDISPSPFKGSQVNGGKHE